MYHTQQHTLLLMFMFNTRMVGCILLDLTSLLTSHPNTCTTACCFFLPPPVRIRLTVCVHIGIHEFLLPFMLAFSVSALSTSTKTGTRLFLEVFNFPSSNVYLQWQFAQTPSIQFQWKLVDIRSHSRTNPIAFSRKIFPQFSFGSRSHLPA